MIFHFIKFIIFIFLLQSCEEPRNEPPADFEAKRKAEPNVEGFNVRFSYTEEGKTTAILQGKHIFEEQISNESTITHLDKGVVLQFLNEENGKVESELTADRAKVYNPDGRGEALGNVIVTNIKGEKLETEKLNWNKQLNRISTHSPVKIITATEVLYGDSMVSNAEFTNYKIFKFKGKMDVKE